MKGDLTLLEEAVEYALSVAATVETWAAGVGNGIVLFNTERVIELEELVRNGLHCGPEAMAVHAVTVWTSGNP